MHSRTPRIDVGQQSPGMQVFEDLKEHCNAPRLSSELVLMEALQAAHPDHIVVRTAKHFCDLIDYAKQGHATAELRTDDGDFDLSRRYIPTGKRIKNKPGKLADSVQWGSYAYNWDGKDFIVYKHEYMDSRRGVVVNLYICHKASDEVIKSGRSDEIDALMHAAGKWTHEIHEEIYVYDGYWSKSKELWKSVNGSSWEEVILDPAMKESLIGDVQGFFDNRDIYKELAVPWKRGIIFHGLPGNGKTVSIKALMSSLYAREDLMVPSLYVKTLVNCNGPQYAIRQIFDHARTMAPCLLIFEDLDSLVTDEVRSYFLNEVDGLESNDGILMVGSTNHLEKLDPAITKRPSRFDRKYQFKIPGEEERVLYCQYWRKKVSKSRLVDFPEEAATIIAKLTEGFSFAYLKELFVMTLLSIARGNEAPKPEEQEVSRFINGLTDVSADHGKEEESEANGERGKEVEANDENEIEHPDPHQVKRTIPDIEVLEALQNNVLINVARRNIQILLDDMDNTGADEGTAAKHLSTRQLRQQQPIGARVIGYQQAVPICL